MTQWANHGRKLNDNCRPGIDHNQCAVLTRDPQIFAGRFGNLIKNVVKLRGQIVLTPPLCLFQLLLFHTKFSFLCPQSLIFGVLLENQH